MLKLFYVRKLAPRDWRGGVGVWLHIIPNLLLLVVSVCVWKAGCLGGNRQ